MSRWVDARRRLFNRSMRMKGIRLQSCSPNGGSKMTGRKMTIVLLSAAWSVTKKGMRVASVGKLRGRDSILVRCGPVDSRAIQLGILKEWVTGWQRKLSSRRFGCLGCGITIRTHPRHSHLLVLRRTSARCPTPGPFVSRPETGVRPRSPRSDSGAIVSTTRHNEG